MRKFIVTLAMILLSADTCCGKAAQPLVAWTRTVTTSSSTLSGISIDGAGHIYLAGSTFAALDGTSFGSRDGFLAKYTSDGSKTWIQQFGTEDHDAVNGGPAIGSGGIYSGGSTFGEFQSPNAGSIDAFIYKQYEDGSFAWARQFGTSAIDSVNDVSTDSAGNVYFAAQTDGTIDGVGGGSRDGIVGKYDLNGDLLWRYQFGTSAFEVPRAIATDSSGASILAGFTMPSFSSGSSTQDVLLASYDTNGNEVWSKKYGSDDLDQAISAAADGFGNFFVAGTTHGVLDDSGGGGGDAFLSKFDSSGNLLWTRQYGGPLRESAFSVAADKYGNVYIAGTILDTPIGVTINDSDGFLAKYNAAGQLLWEYKLTGPSIQSLTSVSPDDYGNVYVAGGSRAFVGSTNTTIFLTKLVEVPEPRSFLVALLATTIIAVRRDSSRGKSEHLVRR